MWSATRDKIKPQLLECRITFDQDRAHETWCLMHQIFKRTEISKYSRNACGEEILCVHSFLYILLAYFSIQYLTTSCTENNFNYRLNEVHFQVILTLNLAWDTSSFEWFCISWLIHGCKDQALWWITCILTLFYFQFEKLTRILRMLDSAMQTFSSALILHVPISISVNMGYFHCREPHPRRPPLPPPLLPNPSLPPRLRQFLPRHPHPTRYGSWWTQGCKCCRVQMLRKMRNHPTSFLVPKPRTWTCRALGCRVCLRSWMLTKTM